MQISLKCNSAQFLYICPMLSILIPIYNINCVKLVTDLHAQCRKANIRFEILCYDDGSRPPVKNENKPLAQLVGVSYVELKENMGRARIRNLLGKYSNFENLLFIDADSKVPNKSFIKNYVPYLNRSGVVYGGRQYTKRKPTAKHKLLHWTYGTRREALPAKKRNRNPYLNFMSNNFILSRKVFEEVRFDPTHEGYGYEDTLFASVLAAKNIPLWHLDNPLIHTGIESASIFLEKTRNAMENLAELYLDKRIIDTRLIRFYKKLGKLGLRTYAYSLLQSRIDRMKRKLIEGPPDLRRLNLFKLYYFMYYLDQRNAFS